MTDPLSTDAATSRGRQKRGGATPPTMRYLGGVVLALLAAAALTAGAVHGATQLFLFPACALALGLGLHYLATPERSFSVTAPFALLAAIALLTAAQLAPLPRALVHLLSPEADGIFEQALGDYSFHALSIDPSATARELAKLVAYLSFYVAAAIFCRRTRRREQLVIAVAAVATLVTLAGMLNALILPDNVVFVLPRPTFRQGLVRGTFVNPNHFAALLCIAMPCTIAIALTVPRFKLRALLALVIQNLGLVLSASRAGIAAGLFGEALTAFFLLRSAARDSRRGGESARPLVIVAAPVLIALASAAVLMGDRLTNKLIYRTAEEFWGRSGHFEMWSSGLRVIGRFPWTGVGHGAFVHAYPLVSERAGHFTVRWMENLYLEALADWGILAGGLVLALGAWTLVTFIRRRGEGGVVVGALGGLLAFAADEPYNFAIEAPGVALAALALAAVLCPIRGRQLPQPRFNVRPWVPAVAGLLALASVGLLLIPAFDADEEALRARVRDRAVPAAVVIAEAALGWRAHPADYMFPLLAADGLSLRDQPGALTWINRALVLSPRTPESHLLAGDILAGARRRSQALLEYRTAATCAADPRVIWTHVEQRYPDVNALRATVPEPHDAKALGFFVTWLVSRGRAGEAVEPYRELLREAPADPAALEFLFHHAMAERRAPEAVTLATAMVRADPDGERPRSFLVEAKILAGDLAGAAQLLDDSPLLGRRGALEIALAAAYVDKGDLDRAAARLDRVDRLAMIGDESAAVQAAHALRTHVQELRRAR